MVEQIGRVFYAERVRRFEDKSCPRNYCMHEFREDHPREDHPVEPRKI